MRIVFLCLLAFLSACSSGGQGRHGTFRIGVDSTWTPLNFEAQQSYVNGYIEDVLLEMARYHGIAFEKIPANYDALVEGLGQGRYDAILSSMPPLEFHTAKYNFSKNFLNTGLVLITGVKSKYKQIEDLSEQLVGIIAGSPAALLLEKNPTILIRTYPSMPAVLNAVANQEISAAVVSRLPAAAFIRDLYNNTLRIVGSPLTHDGLHAITPKKEDRLIHLFNQSIDQMRKKKTLESLEKKWQLQ